MISRGISLTTLLLVALLAGCTVAPRQPPPVEAPWEARRSELQARDTFELRGRVAVVAGEEGFNARLRWEQAGAQSSVALDGPLGVGGVRVTADDQTFSIITSRGEQLNSEAARAELATRLGFEPPLSSLRYWILGVPDPAYPAEEILDDQQRLTTLRQDGWQIDYERYAAAQGQWLPSRLTLTRGDVRVRLLVDAWES